MNPSAVKQLVILGLCGIAAVLFGSLLASDNYDLLLLISYLLVGIYVLAAPGFVPLLAFGFINPFVLPIPFVFNVPFLLLILGICCVKFFFRNALSRAPKSAYRHCLTWAVIGFFAWVVFRYSLRPVLPNLSGFGGNVTGFRSYLNYGVCFALVLLLPLFLTNRTDLVRLFRWIGGISVIFILFLIPFVFSKSFMAALWLQRFGLYVTMFDNGWLRFVALPGLGLNLLILSFFPNIVPASRRVRLLVAFVGILAIVMGGNRGTVIMAFISVVTFLFVRRRAFAFAAVLVGTTFLFVAVYFIGEQLDFRRGVGFMRVLSLGSQRIAEQSGAADTVEWRMIRWKRAMEEIRAHPVVGKGYGGLENAWIFADWAQFETAIVEVDLASGGIHNGYLSAAYSLGIPALLFFAALVVSQIVLNFRRARLLEQVDGTASDLHCLVLVNLVAFLPSIYAGTDLNSPLIWLYLALGVLLRRLDSKEVIAEKPVSAMPMAANLLPLRMRA
jgi:hypothetical protein